MGEPAGIGPDVTLACWLERRERRLPPFYCLADPDALAARARLLGLSVPIEVVEQSGAAAAFGRALPVVPLQGRAKGAPGTPDRDDAGAVIEAIARAAGDIRAGLAAAMVTNPIAKKPLYDAGFSHPGHTEFLGTLASAWGANRTKPVMMLAGSELRTVPVTIHLPLAEVPAALSEALIVETARITAADLVRRFGLAAPRLAIAGLNPHAGEGGALGGEDISVIAPAIEALRAEGIAAEGPFPADALFHAAARATYDVAICMYHDQALIPVKTLAFAETVNVTLGLPFIRTSPDHGTAFAIAGTGKADPSSLAAALRSAAEFAVHEAAG